MARELRLNREIHRREAVRTVGWNVHNPYNLLLHARFAAGDVDHLALPEDTANAHLCQNTDGSFAFMIGFSSLGGPDQLA